MRTRVIERAIQSLLLLLSTAALVGCLDTDSGIALGTLERDRVAHTATVNEVITDLPMAQGTFVTKGTVLVRMDDRLQRAKVDKAKAEAARAQAQLDKLRKGAREEEIAAAKARVAGARAELVEAEKTFARNQDLIKGDAVSQARLDLALATRDAASASLRSAEEQLRELINGTREEDLRMAESELNAAKAVLASEEKFLSDLTIVASRDGVLDNLPWNLGERVTIGSPVAVLLAGESPYARVYVPEPYRLQIQEGDVLKVRVDGRSETMDGAVRWISSEPAFTPYYALNQEDRSHLMYLAEIQLPRRLPTCPTVSRHRSRCRDRKGCSGPGAESPLWRFHRRRHNGSFHREGHHLWFPRPERLWKNHHHPDDDRSADPLGGGTGGARPLAAPRRGEAQASDRLHDADLLALRRPHRSGEPPVRGTDLTAWGIGPANSGSTS